VPIMAPALGGAMLSFAGWRVIFWAACVYGVIGTVMVWFWLPDTLPESRRIHLTLGGIASRYVGIAKERTFLTHALTGGFGLAALFSYLAGSPSAFIEQYHLTPAHYGMLFGLNSLGYITASQVNARILPRFGADRLLTATVLTFAAATVLLLVDAFTHFGGVLGLVVPLVITMTSLGFVLPTATVGALSRHASHAASASALMGTWQFLLGAIMGTIVGVASDGTARPMAVLMILCGISAVVADRFRPRLREKGTNV
jgi:DHA1 family bicyclomycin/chloramphenicol resistance-like MFS transporter